MNLSQRAAVLRNALENFLRSPVAWALPDGVSHLLRELCDVVGDMAGEIEKIKGDI